MAFPTINMFEELATSHQRDPSSKSARETIKVYCYVLASYHICLVLRVALVLKYAYNLPVSGWREELFSQFSSVQLSEVETTAGSTLGQEIRAAIPFHVRQRMELACDTRDSLHQIQVELVAAESTPPLVDWLLRWWKDPALPGITAYLPGYRL